jgi:hypothetical protein
MFPLKEVIEAYPQLEGLIDDIPTCALEYTTDNSLLLKYSTSYGDDGIINIIKPPLVQEGAIVPLLNYLELPPPARDGLSKGPSIKAYKLVADNYGGFGYPFRDHLGCSRYRYCTIFTGFKNCFNVLTDLP